MLDRHTRFVHALREAGLPASLAEGLDAVNALRHIDLADRESLRAAYAASLVKRQAHRASFDLLFDLYFPIRASRGSPIRTAGAPGQHAQAVQEERGERDELRQALLEGDEARLRELARQGVSRYGRGPVAGGGQSWFSSDVLNRLSPDTLMAGLLREVLAGAERDGPAEKAARRMLGDRIARFKELVAADVRGRLAEERGVDRIAEATVRPPLEQIDFLRATREDLDALRRAVYPLARRLVARLARRRGRRGRLDFRRTVRASLSTGGVPVVTHHRPRRPHRPELVVLCDASGSVASFAHFTLLLTFALREQFTKVRAFAFVDTVDEISRFFTPGPDLVDAMTAMTREARLVRRTGHSDYGRAFTSFAGTYGDVVGPRSSLLILGDARNNYQAPAIPVVKDLVARARHAYWLNPEPRREWDTGDSAASEYAAVIPMHECRNAAQLTAFIERLS